MRERSLLSGRLRAGERRAAIILEDLRLPKAAAVDLLVAALLGGVIGFERETRHKAAGLLRSLN